MIPTAETSLTFWEKFFELHYKMMFSGTESVQNHMYSSEPLEWPLMSRGIAYWVSSTSNVCRQTDFMNIILILYILGSDPLDREFIFVVFWYRGNCCVLIIINILFITATEIMF